MRHASQLDCTTSAPSPIDHAPTTTISSDAGGEVASLPPPPSDASTSASNVLVASTPAGIETIAPTKQEIVAAIQRAELAAAGFKARDELPFSLDSTCWPDKVPITAREANWMRIELSRVMTGVGVSSLPATCNGSYTITNRRKLVQRRGGNDAAADLRLRPALYDYIVDNTKMHIINFGTKENSLKLAEHGFGSVPCGIPDCYGCNGK